MSMKSKEEWEQLYKLQDEVLLYSKNISDIVLAGGTGFNRFLLSKPVRYSEDLDIFLEPPYDSKKLRPKMREFQKSMNDYEIQDIIKVDDNAIKFFIANKSTKLKIELLSTNCKRFTEPIDSEFSPKIEHPQEVLLYKLAAIADRSATRDLFDIYLLTKLKVNQFRTKDLLEKINDKLEDSYGYEYDLKYILNGIKNTRVNQLDMFVDLTPDYQSFYEDFKKDLASFKKELIISFVTKQDINFNLFDKIKSISKHQKLETKESLVEYLEYEDVDNFSRLEKKLMTNEYSNEIEIEKNETILINDGDDQVASELKKFNEEKSEFHDIKTNQDGNITISDKQETSQQEYTKVK